MADLVLTIICSTSIAIILKKNSSQNGNSILLLSGNYFSASIISLLLFVSEKNASVSLDLIPFGMFLAILFVGSIFLFSKSVGLSGAALSTVSSRLSVFVPTILSIIFFKELPSHYQVFGLILTLITILFFYFSIKKGKDLEKDKLKFFLLVGVLLGIGIADFFMKVFQENWSSEDKPLFLFWIFFFSFLITLYISIKKHLTIEKNTLGLGFLMGIPNIFSSYFLIDALKSFSAVIVFPIVNISIILLTSLIVKVFWNEEWNKFSILALVTGLIAIIFLSI